MWKHDYSDTPVDRTIYIKPTVPTNFCSDCGAKLPEDAKFCPQCGHALALRDSRDACACGATLRPKAKYCAVCGRARA